MNQYILKTLTKYNNINYITVANRNELFNIRRQAVYHHVFCNIVK